VLVAAGEAVTIHVSVAEGVIRGVHAVAATSSAPANITIGRYYYAVQPM